MVMPAGSTFRESDWRVLCSFWHPIAFVHEVTDKPVAARLLDTDLVIYRTSAGITVAHDICPHRGTRLSLGTVSNDCLVCPMHHLQFNAAGSCTRVPAVSGPAQRISSNFRLHTVMADIRCGIVWACLSGTPIWPLPTWEATDQPHFARHYFPTQLWQTSAGRRVENFNDQARFPVAAYDVEHTEHGLRYSIPEVLYTYELTFPFSTLVTVRPEGWQSALWFADTVCPVSAHESRIFQLSIDPTGRADEKLWLRYALKLNGDDRLLVESQRPKDLPLDVRAEKHIPADHVSIAYRRALVKFGLGAALPESAVVRRVGTLVSGSK